MAERVSQTLRWSLKLDTDGVDAAKHRTADGKKGKSHRDVELNAEDANALRASLGLKVVVMVTCH